MKRTIAIAVSLLFLAGAGVIMTAQRAETQSAGVGSTLIIGIYTPTVQFKNSAARLNYVKTLAKAVSAAVGSDVEGRSFTSLAALKKSKVDFGIIDAQCVAGNLGKWDLLARAKVGGKTSQAWALYSSEGPRLDALKGKKLSYVKMGCSDTAYVYNAMLESEVGQKGYFSGLVGKPDVNGAVAEVASYKGAQGVFAPVGGSKGLSKVLDVESVPTPAFVVMNDKLPKSLKDKARSAVIGYGGSGAINGWAAADASPYKRLKSRMSKRVLKPAFAAPKPVRVDSKDVLVTPKSLGDAAYTEITQHFDVPPARQ